MTSKVEKRTFGDTSLGAGTVVSGQSIDILPPSVGGMRTIVTAVGPAVGSVNGTPAFVGAVNDEPVFVVNTVIPLYRDLALNDEGPDVKALQAAFGVATTGKVSRALHAAVEAMYKAAGFRIAPDALIPAGQLIAVPTGTFTVTSAASIGQILSSDSKLTVLQTSPNVISLRVPINRLASAQVGAAVVVRVGSESLPAKITSVGAFQQPDANKDGSIAGHDVIATLDDPGAAGKLAQGTIAVVESSIPAPVRIVVPVQAIRTAGDGSTYVRISKTGQITRSAVTVIAEVDGYVAISGKVKAGERVVIN